MLVRDILELARHQPNLTVTPLIADHGAELNPNARQHAPVAYTSLPTPVTTNRNNRNRPGILIFRAKLHTSEFVSTPSCATMKPTWWRFKEGKAKPLIVKSSKEINRPIVKSSKKINRPVGSVLGATWGKCTLPDFAESAQLSGFKTCNSFPFNIAPKKSRSFFSGFQDSEPAAPIAIGVQ